MRIIDTHTHIYSEQFDDIDLVVKRAQKAGVEKLLLPNIDVESIAPLNALAIRYPGFCIPMMGLHPTSVTKNWEEQLSFIKETLYSSTSYVAVGEIGLDLYWDKTFEVEQIKAFKEQLEWSIELNLPISIHSRNAAIKVAKCIKQIGPDKLKGVFHSFTGDEIDLRTVTEMGNFLVGINGIVTFKNSALPIILKEIDLSRIVIETDAPYLAPNPYRGKRNEPAYTQLIVEKLAEIYNTDPETVGNITTENAEKLFKLS